MSIVSIFTCGYVKFDINYLLHMSRQDWAEGTAQDFLGLSDVDMALVETKVALTRALRRQREASLLTQVEVAQAMRTSQSRVARIEAGDPSVSLDLVFKALYTVGMTPRDVGGFIMEAATPYQVREHV